MIQDNVMYQDIHSVIRLEKKGKQVSKAICVVGWNVILMDTKNDVAELTELRSL